VTFIIDYCSANAVILDKLKKLYARGSDKVSVYDNKVEIYGKLAVRGSLPGDASDQPVREGYSMTPDTAESKMPAATASYQSLQ
jgi:hypothetical protein